MSDARLRQLRIKSGVVKRLAKEKVTYEKEATEQQEKIHKLKEQNKDSHVIKKQEEVLQESFMMIPDCQRRLLKAYEDLKRVIATEEDLKESEEYIEAEEVLKTAETQLLDKSLNI